MLSALCPGEAFTADPFPKEIEGAAFLRSSDRAHPTNQALERMGYFPFPTFSQKHKGVTALFSKVIDQRNFERSDFKATYVNLFAGIESDQWAKVPEGKKIRIFDGGEKSKGKSLWQFPEGTTFLHRIWRRTKQGHEPFEFRILKKFKVSWMFATYIPDGEKLKLLVDPEAHSFELPDIHYSRSMTMARVGYSRCVGCHIVKAGVALYGASSHQVELAPCEFLPNNSQLEAFLLERFKTKPSFFTCDPGFQNILCPKDQK